MADYFLDDASNATNDGASWATCYNTWAQVATAGILTAANRLIVGADANITDPGAALTITGPASGLPCVIISSTVGTGTAVAYAAGTGKQVDTDSGAYTVTFDGSFAVYGLKVAAGSHVILQPDTNESAYFDGCTFALADNTQVQTNGSASRFVLKECIVDCSADTTARSTIIITDGSSTARWVVINCSFTNCSNRTGALFQQAADSYALISGCDFSSATNATTCELLLNTRGRAVFTNCLTKASPTYVTTTPMPGGSAEFHNCWDSDAPALFSEITYFGTVVSSSSIYRTGGATIEGDACSWLITTTANCAEGAPFYTPWIYGTVGSTGSKTFDLYITNDTADFDNSQVWLEVEHLSTADEALWALASDQRDNGTGAFISITEAVDTQTDDTTSTWTGTGPSFTYKQKLSVTATVNESGQYRARVAVGVASIAGSRYFYVDPKVTVS